MLTRQGCNHLTNANGVP